MEPESPSPYPQVPATCPYPEPTPSSPHDPLQLPEDSSCDTNLLILVNNQLDAKFFFSYMFIPNLYMFRALMVIVRKINCINTTSGICHSM